MTIIFIGIILFHSTTIDKTLRIENEVNMYITKINKYKGVMLLNDSFVISENCPKINSAESESKSTIGIIKEPFQIIKKSYNDTIQIVQDNKIFYYKLLDMK